MSGVAHCLCQPRTRCPKTLLSMFLKEVAIFSINVSRLSFGSLIASLRVSLRLYPASRLDIHDGPQFRYVFRCDSASKDLIFMMIHSFVTFFVVIVRQKT